MRRFLEAEWPFEGTGIEGSGVPMLVFEFDSNDHECNSVIMEVF
jgi:hypothetical protein